MKKLIPVLCGSAYKNIGVQPLMDSVILYLPSPEKQSKKFDAFKDNLAARAFKVLHDKQKGPLVFLRIYNGVLNRGQKLFNMDKNSSEQTTKLLMAHANDFDEVETVDCGNIAVVTGLKVCILLLCCYFILIRSFYTANNCRRLHHKFRGKRSTS